MNEGNEGAAPGLLSVERVVAFILGPAITAGSGWLSLLLAKKFGIHLSGAEIVGVFATGGAGAAGLIYKWLHGRQLEMSLKNNLLVEEVRSSPAEGFLTTTARDMEGLAQSAALHAVQSVTGSSQSGAGAASGQ